MVRGRKPEEGQARSEVLKVRLTPSDRADIEATRGTESTAQFAREAIRDRVRARRGA